MYALVDGNNFYVSCHGVFLPELVGRPVVVLGNGDSCAVARSNEAKALGIKMGAPWFQIKHLEKEVGLVALSANFALYGDLSDRMMSLAAGLGSNQEIFSIDESFLDLSAIPGCLIERSHKIRARILQWVGIPCCIGIGATKTLAKLANHVAKSAERKPGSYPPFMAQVCNLAALQASELAAVFAATAVSEVWGVGQRITTQLNEAGIHTVLEFSRMEPAMVRRRWSVVLEKTLLELNGIACFELDTQPAPKREIACTRSFGHTVTSLAELSEAITEFASKAAQKLRKQGSHAVQVLVFIRTSPFSVEAQYSRSITVPLRRPSSDTVVIVAAALVGLKGIFQPGFKLAKAGVMLLDLQPDTVQQGELDWQDEVVSSKSRVPLMAAMDALNLRYGNGTVLLASAGLAGDCRTWMPKQARLTPQYTTRWADMPIAWA